MNTDQINHYTQKLQYEMDAWDLFLAVENGDDIVIIDARSPEVYFIEHIPNAINFPHRIMNKDTAAKKLNFDALYVTYCDGIGCNASTKSALILAKLGYRVKELIGGLDWWKRDNYPTVQKEASATEKSSYECGC